MGLSYIYLVTYHQKSTLPETNMAPNNDGFQ